MHRANQVRAITKELAAIAEEHAAAIILVHHVNKGQGQQALMRAAGSYDLAAAVRIAHLFGVSPSDDTLRAMIGVKSNLSAGSAPIGCRIDADGRFTWTGPSALTAEDVLSAGSEVGGALKEAVAFLQRALEGGRKRWVTCGMKPRRTVLASRPSDEHRRH